EVQQTARRLVLEMPPSKGLESLLWSLEPAAVDDRLLIVDRLAQLDLDPRFVPRWQQLARDGDRAVADKALEVLATRAAGSVVPLLVEQLPHASYNVQQTIAEALRGIAAQRGPEFADQLLPLVASGHAGTRTAVLKILVGIGDVHEVIKRYVNFTRTLPGFVRARAIDSLRQFGDDIIEPMIELLADADDETRAAAIGIASLFDDVRIVPSTIPLLKDPDWWIRIAAADTLGRLKDSRAVEPLVAALADEDVRWTAVEALGRIADPRALNALGKILADPQPNVRIEVLDALKGFAHPQVPQVLTKVATTDADRNVRSRAVTILNELSGDDAAKAQQVAEVRDQALKARSIQGEPRLHTFLIHTRNTGASDFHLTVGQPPVVRVAAELLRAQGDPFSAEDTSAMVKEILSDAQWQTLQTRYQLDFCYTIPQAGRYRGNVFIDHHGVHGVFRVIPDMPPTIQELGLPAHLAEIADYHQGLVLICGPSGSGKSTTLAALVNLFNETRHDHVITLEDPVEFVHPFKNCLINQREVGTHTESFARALRAALREDPDVIVIGELRDNESISLALTAAETGHIVLGTLSSTSAPKAIDRILSSFSVDEQPQIRASLSESLKFVIAQRLLPAKTGRKRVACFEVLKGTTNVASMIRDEKTYQLYSAMQVGRAAGNQTFDDALKDLVRRDLISPESGYMAALKKEDFEPLVSAEFLRKGSA
ncbi:MAG TPA: PilT/PilU family type 4a pilus ATPase, partial [Thermoanaerobaculia bacterium]|nr:PilT/PilU family type 4a pilus ATPase [Thermoanaerobaculia bacterium]